MKVVPLGSIAVPMSARAGQQTDLPVYSVTKHAGFVPSLEYFKKQVFSREVADYKVVEQGQFAYATIHLDEGSVGIAPERALISPMYTVFAVDASQIDRNYLIRYLKSPRALSRYSQLGKGAVHRRKAITFESLAKLDIPLPALVEQRRIAAILDAADAIRSKRKAVLAHLDALPTTVFQKVFSGLADTVKMSELVEEFRYGTSNKSGATGYPTLRIPNVLGGAISVKDIKTVDVTPSELDRLTLREGDLLFVRTNGNANNIGRSAVFSSRSVQQASYGDQPWIYASYLIRARLDRGYDPRFIAAYLETASGRRQLRERSKTSAGQFNINTESLGTILVPAAALSAQQAFAANVARIDAQRAAVQRALAADDELFASLQSRAFSGKL